MDYMGTEIRTFYSLKEIKETIEEQIEFYKSLVDDYSQWLGSFLRNYEETYGDEEWFKKLAELSKTLKAERKPKKTEKKGKKKKKEAPLWINFKEIMLSASEQGEAEILFEAIEKINEKIERLEKIRAAIEDLERIGIGKEILYITYVNDGIPEKIVLKHKKGEEFAEKFEFIADLSALRKF